MAGIIPRNNKLFSLDEKEIFVDGKPIENWLKNDFNSEYSIDISDFQFQAEKGLFHIFGELFTSEINFIRNDQPDITTCALSLGKKAGQSTCPEHESFQNNYRIQKILAFIFRIMIDMGLKCLMINYGS